MNFIFVLADQLRADSVGTFGKSIVRTPNLDRLAVGRGASSAGDSTPIDGIASSGDAAGPGVDAVAFENCYVQHTVCTPSRCSIFTGWYPHVRGHRTLTYLLQADEPNLLRSLREAGYWVEWHGKNDLLSKSAFDSSVDRRGTVPTFTTTYDGNPWPDGHRLRKSFYFGNRPVEQSTDQDHDWVAVRNAREFLTRVASGQGGPDRPAPGQPFFLYLPLIFPHPPYYVEEPYFSLYDRAAVPPPAIASYESLPAFVRAYHEVHGLGGLSDDDYREIIATYYGMITRTDALIGSLLDALEESGLAGETTVVVTSDHGDYTGDYGLVEKWWTGLTDNLTRVPLYLRSPRAEDTSPPPPAGEPPADPAGTGRGGPPAAGAAGVRETPRSSDALVESIDILPTILELAGLPVDHPQFGRSLVPILRGGAHQHRDYVFAEGGHHPEDLHCREPVLDESLAWGIYTPKTTLPAQSFAYLHNSVMVRSRRWKYIRHLTDTDELYDLSTDPREEHNLAGLVGERPELAEVARTHREALLDWYMRTADIVPFETGPRDF